MGIEWIKEYFSDVETEKEYDGYYYSIADAITIAILGSICGLKNVSQIHQWAASGRVSEFLREKFAIERVPCYYWLLCLLKMVKPESLNRCFTEWVRSLVPADKAGLTVALDGKTVCSTAKMGQYGNPLHIISAQLSELGMTFAQKTVEGKSNEIPAVQELLRHLDVSGCMVVADAMHCQKETAKAVMCGKANYLLKVKDNQPTLKADIEAYVQDEELQRGMKSSSTHEKNRERVEKRTAFVTNHVSWLAGVDEWEGLCCIGAIHSEVEAANEKSDTWHYYISGKGLNPDELLRHARMEWAVETMHWLLDVHFREDFFRVLDKNVQQNMNILRKLALNLIKTYKERSVSKKPLSHIMLNALLDPAFLLTIMDFPEN